MAVGNESEAGDGQLRARMAFPSMLSPTGMDRRGHREAFLRVVLALLAAALVVVPGCGSGRVSSTNAPAAAPSFTSKLRVVPGLAEPLVTTKATTEAEDRAVAEATEGRDGAIAPLLAFRAAHPDSGWNAAIDTNLGLAYYRQGFFSKAIASYEAAWKEGRGATDFRAKTLVDRAVGELARMHARVGHLAQLDALVAEIGARPIQGGGSELLTAAREGAWTMHHNPGISYLCGPKALQNVLQALRATPAAIAVVEAARSGEHGFSLAEVSALAEKAGLAHRLVHREPGEPVPVPSVINWNLRHYAAVVGRTDRGTYYVKDPTFGGDLELSEAAIDEEGSGFFLVPTAPVGDAHGDLRLAWKDATQEEARNAYGMGFPNSYLLGAVKAFDFLADIFGTAADSVFNKLDSLIPTLPSCNGMCVPNAHAMEVSLNLKDTPVGYAPPVGPPAYISLVYNQREAVEPNGPPANAASFNVGPQWTLNVLSYILDNPARPGATVSRYVPGGGAIPAYTGYSTMTGAFDPEPQSAAVLRRTPATGIATSYTLTGTDGSQLVYAQNDGSTVGSTYRRLFLTAIKDPAGNALTLNYDTARVAPDAGVDGGPSGFGSAAFLPRLANITDSAGTKTTTFCYDPTRTACSSYEGSSLLVTQITDAFGRSALIDYDTNGRLSRITDVIGISSSVSYDDDNTRRARPSSNSSRRRTAPPASTSAS